MSQLSTVLTLAHKQTAGKLHSCREGFWWAVSACAGEPGYQTRVQRGAGEQFCSWFCVWLRAAIVDTAACGGWAVAVGEGACAAGFGSDGSSARLFFFLEGGGGFEMLWTVSL